MRTWIQCDRCHEAFPIEGRGADRDPLEAFRCPSCYQPVMDMVDALAGDEFAEGATDDWLASPGSTATHPHQSGSYSHHLPVDADPSHEPCPGTMSAHGPASPALGRPSPPASSSARLVHWLCSIVGALWPRTT